MKLQKNTHSGLASLYHVTITQQKNISTRRGKWRILHFEDLENSFLSTSLYKTLWGMAMIKATRKRKTGKCSQEICLQESVFQTCVASVDFS